MKEDRKKKNNWYVVTGSPYSGKTTVLDLLKKKGFKVIPEAARVFIDEQIKKGQTIEEIRANEEEFQKRVLRLKINTEEKLDLKETIFFDRGIPDSTAYYKANNIPTNEILNKAVKNCNYKKVFLFESLGYLKDYARTENKSTARKLEKLLEKSYTDLGLQVIKVPKISVAKRAKFILSNL